jgi:hypothetical protein
MRQDFGDLAAEALQELASVLTQALTFSIRRFHITELLQLVLERVFFTLRLY